jgi:hypothetical protein
VESFLNFIPVAEKFFSESEGRDNRHDYFNVIASMERMSLFSRARAITHWLTGSFCKSNPSVLTNLETAISIRNAATHSRPNTSKSGEAHYAVTQRKPWIRHLNGLGIITENDYMWLSDNQLIESRIVSEWVIQSVFSYFDHLISETEPTVAVMRGFHPYKEGSGFVHIYEQARSLFEYKINLPED